MNGRRPAATSPPGTPASLFYPGIEGVYYEGKRTLRELLTCYNRLSLFLDLPEPTEEQIHAREEANDMAERAFVKERLAGTDPKHATTVLDAAKDHDAP